MEKKKKKKSKQDLRIKIDGTFEEAVSLLMKPISKERKREIAKMKR